MGESETNIYPFSFNLIRLHIERRFVMKKKLLHIVTLLFFSLGCVYFMFNALSGGITTLLPLKISPQIQPDQYTPQQKKKYNPSELHRIYLFERIHKSVERGKKGITC